MKKLNILGLFLLMLTFFTGCKEETIVLTSELPQFETREGLMLLEGIVPYGTGINDQIYIYGAFNGGEEAIGDPQWKLERGNPATGVPAKFGIYLNPSSFVDGKTLADGYSFYNIQSGPELDLEGNVVWHYDYPALGQRLNVFIDYWEGSFDTPESPEEVEHDGYAIYVINNTGWVELALYAWGDAEAFGGWPGMPVTGRMEVNGTMYQYFDTGASNEGLNLNLIFNNNNNGEQLPDFNATLNRDYYFELTPDGVIEIDPNASIEHDGYAVFVYNNAGWEDLHIWVWPDGGDGADFLGVEWPGLPFTGTQMINGVAYSYYDFGSAHNGETVNIIVNDNGSPQTGDVGGIVLDKNYYFELSGTTLTPIDPETFQPEGTPDEPSEPEPTPTSERYVYVQNETGWSPLYLYTWNDAGTQLCGAWPGTSSTETVEMDGATYTVFLIQSDDAENNLIFNDGVGGEGGQLADFNVVLNQNYYLKVTSTGVTELEPPTINIYADNQTTWDEIALYAWGDGPELFGGWPGLVSTTTETVNGVEYLVYPVPANGLTYNLIFNNNNHELQLKDFPVTLDKNIYLVVTDEGVKFAE